MYKIIKRLFDFVMALLALTVLSPLLIPVIIGLLLTGEHYVFMVPSNGELDLKKAAKLSGNKKAEMIPMKELLPVTGYIRGGCSPVGMKKPFKTVIHHTAENFDTIIFSAGKIGYQVQLSLTDLTKAIKVITEDIIVE